jgi:hypothetical protein
MLPFQHTVVINLRQIARGTKLPTVAANIQFSYPAEEWVASIPAWRQTNLLFVIFLNPAR